jgi:hypothetical protein
MRCRIVIEISSVTGHVMKIATRIPFSVGPGSEAVHSTMIMFLYGVVALGFLVLICAASMSPGTPMSDIASMSVFP